jgi:hypothetical protein
MSDEPIDLDQKRRERQAREASVYFCECGNSLLRCWSDGLVECINCAAMLEGLWVVEHE